MLYNLFVLNGYKGILFSVWSRTSVLKEPHAAPEPQVGDPVAYDMVKDITILVIFCVRLLKMWAYSLFKNMPCLLYVALIL